MAPSHAMPVCRSYVTYDKALAILLQSLAAIAMLQSMWLDSLTGGDLEQFRVKFLNASAQPSRGALLRVCVYPPGMV